MTRKMKLIIPFLFCPHMWVRGLWLSSVQPHSFPPPLPLVVINFTRSSDSRGLTCAGAHTRTTKQSDYTQLLSHYTGASSGSNHRVRQLTCHQSKHSREMTIFGVCVLCDHMRTRFRLFIYKSDITSSLMLDSTSLKILITSVCTLGIH